MSAGKHTPGPWRWDGNTLLPVNHSPETSAVHSILDAEGGYGFLGSKPAATMRELDADRALIAAAPDLLEALVRVTERLDAFSISANLNTRLALEAARSAIAKATGAAA